MRVRLAVMSLGVLLAGGPVYAEMAGAGASDPVSETSAQMSDAGNQFCPVSGDKVSGKDFVTHGGKRYGLCCQMCANKFLKDPEKYLSEMKQSEEAGKTGASAEAKPIEEHHSGHMH